MSNSFKVFASNDYLMDLYEDEYEIPITILHYNNGDGRIYHSRLNDFFEIVEKCEYYLDEYVERENSIFTTWKNNYGEKLFLFTQPSFIRIILKLNEDDEDFELSVMFPVYSTLAFYTYNKKIRHLKLNEINAIFFKEVKNNLYSLIYEILKSYDENSAIPGCL